MDLKIFLTVLFVLIGSSLQFDSGIIYKYDYETHILLNEDPGHNNAPSRDVGYKLTANVLVTNVWQSETSPDENLLRINILNPKLHVPVPKSEAYKEHDSPIAPSITPSPLYMYNKNGKVEKVFLLSEEEITGANLKKGIASMLHFIPNSKELIEVDVSGECKVIYEVTDKGVTKRKKYCFYPKEDVQFKHPNEIQSSTLLTSSDSYYELTENKKVVQSLKGNDQVKMFSNLWSRPTVFIRSEYKLSLQGKENEATNTKYSNIEEAVKSLPEASNLIEHQLVAQIVSEVCTENCKTLTAYVNSYKENLKTENLAKVKSGSAFLKLLEHFRSANKAEIVSCINNKKNKIILPQILDLVAAAQTSDAIDAAFEALDFTGSKIDLLERFLLSLSVSSHPSQHLLKKVIELGKSNIKNGKLQETVLLTLGSLTKTYKSICKDDCIVVKEVKSLLESQLEKCSDDYCKLIYLHAFKNAALPETVPTLIDYIKKSRKFSIVALTALQSMNAEYFSDDTRKVLFEVFVQTRRNEDPTARTVAAEILLSSKPDKALLADLIKALSNQDNSEVSTYVVATLSDMMSQNEEIRYAVNDLLKDLNIGNYYNFGQKGSSAAFTKLLSAASGVNITYAVRMEMIGGGLLKRSSFDVDVNSDRSKLPMLSVGLFAKGLSSFAGDDEGKSNSADEEEEATTAGMELTIMGISLRPYVFFTGTGELMGHVWSGTASDPTPAFQGNLLVMDDLYVVPLQNGLVTSVSLKGAFSIDLSASIKISLWNRNSHSVVKNSGALVVMGSSKLNMPFIKSSADFTFSGSSYIDFITDLDFYEAPFSMCLQMDQPEFVFRFDAQRNENIPGSQFKIKKETKRKLFIPAKSYALHHKNSKQCAVMLTDS